MLAVALLATAVSAGAETSDPVIDDAQSPGAGLDSAVAAGQSTDPAVAAYAAEYGVTEAEATRRLDRIQPMQDILASIRELESSRVAGWGIDHAGTFTGWVWLTGDAPAIQASAAIADAHDDIEIRTGAAHTLAELLEAQDSFGNGSSIGAVGRVDNQTSVTDCSAAVTFTAPDMGTNALHIGIDPALLRSDEPPELQGPGGGIGPVGGTDAPAAPTSATDAELAALAAQMTAAYQGHIGVAYSIVDGRDYGETAMFDGGRAMSTCTSGFAARQRISGDYGIITAGHCLDAQRMHGVSLPWVTGYASTTADAQFHRIPSGSGHKLRSHFVYNQSTPPKSRAVRAKESWSAMLGDFVCHTGMVTGSTCGTVTNIYHRPTYAGACDADELGTPADCAARFVRVYGSGLKGCVGDSGGPWYRHATAYGIQMAATDKYDCTSAGKKLTFSAISHVETFLRVDILIAQNVTIDC
ncbi:MAG: hypothetical protein OXF65_12620 [Acidimicrobiaceae bacterium]|nr:hypothetical protein [Acidimicrobiaceae bacterium]